MCDLPVWLLLSLLGCDGVLSGELEYQKTSDYLLISKMMFKDFTQSIIEILGQEGAAIIFFFGVNSGRRSARKRLNESRGNKKRALQLLTELKRKQNWANITFSRLDLENHTGKIWVNRCFCQQDEIHRCYFMKGFLTGFLSEIFGSKIMVSLIAQTNTHSSSCELVFGPPPAHEEPFEMLSN